MFMEHVKFLVISFLFLLLTTVSSHCSKLDQYSCLQTMSTHWVTTL